MKNTLILAFFFLFNNFSIACSCIRKSNVAKEVRNADIVFSGKVISRKEIDTKNPNNQHLVFHSVEYKILLTEMFKGKIKQDTLKIYTGNGGPDCGFGFEINKIYIIYAYEGKDEYSTQETHKFLYTNYCTRTREFLESEYRKIKRYSKKKGYC